MGHLVVPRIKYIDVMLGLPTEQPRPPQPGEMKGRAAWEDTGITEQPFIVAKLLNSSYMKSLAAGAMGIPVIYILIGLRPLVVFYTPSALQGLPQFPQSLMFFMVLFQLNRVKLRGF